MKDRLACKPVCGHWPVGTSDDGRGRRLPRRSHRGLKQLALDGTIYCRKSKATNIGSRSNARAVRILRMGTTDMNKHLSSSDIRHQRCWFVALAIA